MGEGKIDSVVRPSYKGEKSTSEYIKRGKRKIWAVGNIYGVAERRYTSSKDEDLGNGMRQLTQITSPSESVGSIILIKIIPDKLEDTLIFKVA